MVVRVSAPPAGSGSTAGTSALVATLHPPRTDSVDSPITPPPPQTFRARATKSRNYFSSTLDDTHLIITKLLKSECKYLFCKLRCSIIKLLRIYGSINLFDKMSIISMMVYNYRLTDTTSRLGKLLHSFLFLPLCAHSTVPLSSHDHFQTDGHSPLKSENAPPLPVCLRVSAHQLQQHGCHHFCVDVKTAQSNAARHTAFLIEDTSDK